MLLCLFCQTPSVCAQEKVASVTFRGLEKTKVEFVSRFTVLEKGTDYDSLQVLADLQSLRNLQLFSDVSYLVQDTVAGKSITYFCREWVTLLPIVDLGGIRENFWFQLGAVDHNWLGRGNLIGGYYRYYDRHSVEVFQDAPHIRNSRWGLSSNLSRFSTIEPAYFETGSSSYNVDRWNIAVFGRCELFRGRFVQFGGGYLYERYEKNTGKSGPNPPGPDLETFHKYLLKLQLHQDRLNYFYQYLTGYSNILTLEIVAAKNEGFDFWKILNEAKWFASLSEINNLAIRLRSGISSNKDSPFVPFVLDSYINVRGSGNRTSRGTSELTLNLEDRVTLAEPRWGVVQGVGFIDWSSWRPAGGDFSEMLEADNNVTFLGLGIRVHYTRFYNLVFRLDYGMNVVKLQEHGLVVGLGQYF